MNDKYICHVIYDVHDHKIVVVGIIIFEVNCLWFTLAIFSCYTPVVKGFFCDPEPGFHGGGWLYLRPEDPPLHAGNTGHRVTTIAKCRQHLTDPGGCRRLGWSEPSHSQDLQGETSHRPQGKAGRQSAEFWSFRQKEGRFIHRWYLMDYLGLSN